MTPSAPTRGSAFSGVVRVGGGRADGSPYRCSRPTGSVGTVGSRQSSLAAAAALLETPSAPDATPAETCPGGAACPRTGVCPAVEDTLTVANTVLCAPDKWGACAIPVPSQLGGTVTVRGAGFLRASGKRVFAPSATVLVRRPMPMCCMAERWKMDWMVLHAARDRDRARAPSPPCLSLVETRRPRKHVSLSAVAKADREIAQAHVPRVDHDGTTYTLLDNVLYEGDERHASTNAKGRRRRSDELRRESVERRVWVRRVF